MGFFNRLFSSKEEKKDEKSAKLKASSKKNQNKESQDNLRKRLTILDNLGLSFSCEKLKSLVI